jgi:hypothetical protein
MRRIPFDERGRTHSHGGHTKDHEGELAPDTTRRRLIERVVEFAGFAERGSVGIFV